MLALQPRFKSFDEYLAYEDDTDQLYELFNGELIAVPTESGLNFQIANRLFLVFALMLGTDRVRGNGLELEVHGEPKNRFPDLTIIREEHIAQLAKRNTIRLSMLPPLLVVEVVSPGELQQERDYIAKRQQYQACGIPEYWIVDPQTQTVLVLELSAGCYQEVGNFKEIMTIQSPTFPQLSLTVNEIFKDL
ncbi:Uma2 family endonuclease [Synechocystis salina LEGE 06099]|uniref:Uma2 family endonuclease n=1 Tax=Synechocystis salina TaxID=945780 RepID=UPI0018812CEC|nr:Uma2 family endonuclease [Synechocystis salina]MBE9204132.1 Uma2 family endonuclease [Synechocystis salina LEGE 06099]